MTNHFFSMLDATTQKCSLHIPSGHVQSKEPHFVICWCSCHREGPGLGENVSVQSEHSTEGEQSTSRFWLWPKVCSSQNGISSGPQFALSPQEQTIGLFNARNLNLVPSATKRLLTWTCGKSLPTFIFCKCFRCTELFWSMFWFSMIAESKRLSVCHGAFQWQVQTSVECCCFDRCHLHWCAKLARQSTMLMNIFNSVRVLSFSVCPKDPFHSFFHELTLFFANSSSCELAGTLHSTSKTDFVFLD